MTRLPVKRIIEPIKNQGLTASSNDKGVSVFTIPKDGSFKILQLTDLHIGCGFMSRKKDKMAINAIIDIVQQTKPDLIIITGDMVYPVPIHSGTINNMRSTKVVCELFERFKIPWAITFGNHDYEPFATHSKQKIAEHYSMQEHCLYRNDDDTVTGLSNYPIIVNNSDNTVNHILMLLDSNMYEKKSFFSGFDIIHQDQIDWYKRTVNSLSTGKTVENSLAFFHIPCNEYKTAWKLLKSGSPEVTYHLGTMAEKNDHVGTAYRLKDKDKFFEEMVEFRSLKGIFCGHDHLNTISMTYKGIRLTYGMSIDCLAYKKISKVYTQRGGTLITLNDKGNYTVQLAPHRSIVEIQN